MTAVLPAYLVRLEVLKFVAKLVNVDLKPPELVVVGRLLWLFEMPLL